MSNGRATPRKPNCECPICRRGIRILIAHTLDVERTWLSEIGIRIFGRMERVSPALLRSVLVEMCELGVLIEMLDRPKQQRDPISMYMLARLTLPAPCRKGGGE